MLWLETNLPVSVYELAFGDLAILFMAQKTWQTASRDMRTIELVSHKSPKFDLFFWGHLMPSLWMLRTSSRR
jgi:hypothetical protein